MPLDEKQLTNRQHAVPQNIMEVEFKIIGEMTLRQFIYLAIFGAMAYGCAMIIGNFLKWPFVLFFSLVGIAFAFVPISDRGLDEWLASFLRAIYNPTQKVWRKTPEIPKAFTFENLAFVRNELITLAPTTTRRKLESYLDSYNETEEKKEDFEIKEEEFIKKVRETYAYYQQEEQLQGYSVQAAKAPLVSTVETEPLPSEYPKPVPIKKPENVEIVTKKQDTGTPEAETTVVETPSLSFDIKALFDQMQKGGSEVKVTASEPPVTQNAPVQTVFQQAPPEIKLQEEKPKKVIKPPVEVKAKEEVLSPVMQRLLTQIDKTKAEQLQSDIDTKPINDVNPQIDIEIPLQKNPFADFTPKQQAAFQIPQQTPPAPVLKQQPSFNAGLAQEEPVSTIQKQTYPGINLMREFNLVRENSPIMPSITPDRVAGRRFTPLALNNEGVIVLPIRGEKVLKVEDPNEEEVERQLEEKTNQLQQLLEQIRKDSGVISATTAKVVEPKAQQKTQPILPAAEQVKTEESIKKMQSENQQLMEEIAKLRVEMAKASQVKGSFEQQEQIINSAKIEQEVLINQINQLQQKLELQIKHQKEDEHLREEKRIEEERKQAENLRLMIKMQESKKAPTPGQAFPQVQSIKVQPAGPKKEEPAIEPKFVSTQNTITTPNVISGIVKSADGKVIDGVLAIIKRENGDPVRALKTNKLGIFTITTPLSNGTYLIEIDKSGQTGLKFAIINVKLDGSIIPPIEIVGK